ncbi:MAG: 23S rRNA (guanosine(2251)-2'-O)-methyltransferase RlmB, partial [Treponema sp.]|nr:23S rRNA (guanosine(2251)-2'-O)-methyltransferase RlmB [Treponema sp.]
TVQKNDKVAIVMGSEGSGMSRIVRENCDKILSIPTCGKLDSLNVSVAAGILLYKISQ